MAAQIACLNQLPRMAADRNSTYTTSFDFNCILQAKNARLLFACSCELARVYMRPSPTSHSRVHATFVSRVHATPRPSVGSSDLQCRLEIRAHTFLIHNSCTEKVVYFKNPHPKRPQFASEFPWLIYPGWHCCAVPDGTPPAYNSVVPVGCADSRCFQVFNGLQL